MSNATKAASAAAAERQRDAKHRSSGDAGRKRSEGRSVPWGTAASAARGKKACLHEKIANDECRWRF